MTDDAEARLRSLQRRLRREKTALERLNPLDDPERYEEAFRRVIDLEVSRRDLRAAVLGGEGPEGTEPEDPEEW